MRRFLECLLPVTNCNLCCSYCYVIQNEWRTNKNYVSRYSPEHIGKALSKSRLGGVSLISITGAGETFLSKALIPIVVEILKQGHFVNITTNGTITHALDTLLEATNGYHAYLHFSFSLHYVELKKHGLLETFWRNVNKAKNEGCSILVQINLSDEYWECWDEIKKECVEHIGAMPQVALTRDESDKKCFKVMSLRHSYEEYVQKGREMNSPLFDYTVRNFMVKRKEFCYAGLWSGTLNLSTGELSACYECGWKQNIFENLEKPIKWSPVGYHCSRIYCINSSHFMSQGIIPEINDESYGSLRNRKEAHWYTKEAEAFLYGHFSDTNHVLSGKEKRKAEWESFFPRVFCYMKSKARGAKKRILKQK